MLGARIGLFQLHQGMHASKPWGLSQLSEPLVLFFHPGQRNPRPSVQIKIKSLMCYVQQGRRWNQMPCHYLDGQVLLWGMTLVKGRTMLRKKSLEKRSIFAFSFFSLSRLPGHPVGSLFTWLWATTLSRLQYPVFSIKAMSHKIIALENYIKEEFSGDFSLDFIAFIFWIAQKSQFCFLPNHLL